MTLQHDDVHLDIPDFLRFQKEDRDDAWKGKRTLRWTRDMRFDDEARKSEDPATTKLRREIEASERAKAERKAKERSDAARLERRRTSILKEEVKMAHDSIGPKEAQLRNLRNQKPVRIVKITTIELPKPAPIIEAQQETTTMAKTAKKTAKRHPKLPSTHPANRGKQPPKKRAAKAKAPKPAKTARDPAAAKVIRPGSKLEIVVGLLTHAAGCTTADVLKATGWPAVSMPQQARAAGLTLRQEKDGKVTRYWGTKA
jgi:hypothetical protein